MNDTFMKEKPIFPLLTSMALPMVVSMLVNALYNIVDSLFVARISEEAMTALSLVYPVQNLINAIAIGFSIGIAALISLHLGAGNKEKADMAATHGMVLSLIHGVVISIVCTAIMPRFLRSFTSDETVIAMGVTYSRVAFMFAVVIMAAMAFEKIFQAVGRMNITMIGLMGGSVCNIILDPLLIFGIGPFPKMGIAGAALATGIGQMVPVIFYLIVYFVSPIPVRLRSGCLKPDAKMALQLYSIGVPAILNLALPSVLITFLNSLLAVYSQSYVVVLGIYYKLQTFLYLPANGIVQGLRPIIGYNYGAGEYGPRQKALPHVHGHVRCHHGRGHGALSGAIRPVDRAFQLERRDHRHRHVGPAHHLRRLHRLDDFSRRLRLAGGSRHGRAVACHLAVPLHRCHHAAGLAVLPPAGCRRHLERLLGDRGHHGGHFNGRIPQEREAEINQQEPDHSRSGSCFI